MRPIYNYSESVVRPVNVEKSKHTVYIRKDFSEKSRTDGFGNETTYWTYQEAKMTHEEFSEYSKMLTAQNAMSNASDIPKIISGQENGDNNQLIIMEAIADLYDMIASMA